MSHNVMSTGAVAALFGVTTNTVHRWAEDGKLPHFRTPGGHLRFRRNEVEALLPVQDEGDAA